ncbi:MAG TPA: hypothetical protein VJC17_02240 [Candidatus Dojkabacteria bacterium]|nr:hypothetical protein [Candidatus Dojkabacteria bacterium]
MRSPTLIGQRKSISRFARYAKTACISWKQAFFVRYADIQRRLSTLTSADK